MKLMTYNILNGGEAGINLVIDIIKQEAPDFLSINEANTFASNKEIIERISKETTLPYFHLALSGEHDYHVAVFSKYPFKKLEEIKPLMRAGILVVVDTEIGEICIVGTHLTPYTEDLRLPEIERIMDAQKQHQNRILMGDMNSLSKYDDYNPETINVFNDMQMKKFTTERKLRFDVIDKIRSAGYFDVGQEKGKNKVYTAPTASINELEAHLNMRLDYIFVSESLLKQVISYDVVKNQLTDKASDHYPVIVTLN
jgi:exodeoxyribonuclease III